MARFRQDELTEMEWPQFIETLLRLSEPYLSVRNDLLHTQVAHQYCLRLLSAEGGDQRIVEPAVILHDVGWSKLTPEQIKLAFGIRAEGEESKRLNRIHEREGAVIARQILQSLNYPPPWIERIALLIERHDSGKRPEGLEERILKDADKLWRFSRQGFRQELERQELHILELYHYLEGLLSGLFSPAAVMLARAELQDRAREIGVTD